MTRHTAVPSKVFEHGLDRLSQSDQKLVLRKVALLENNPSHPSLRTKKLHGERDLFESRVNDDIRIVWHYGDDNVIIMKDVGHHDILKKY